MKGSGWQVTCRDPSRILSMLWALLVIALVLLALRFMPVGALGPVSLCDHPDQDGLTVHECQ
jgi:hypothetical protein